MSTLRETRRACLCATGDYWGDYLLGKSRSKLLIALARSFPLAMDARKAAARMERYAFRDTRMELSRYFSATSLKASLLSAFASRLPRMERTPSSSLPRFAAGVTAGHVADREYAG